MLFLKSFALAGLLGYANGVYQPNVVSRRGLALENRWILEMEYVEPCTELCTCDEVLARVEELKTREAEGNLRNQRPTTNTKAIEGCYVFFESSERVKDIIEQELMNRGVRRLQATDSKAESARFFIEQDTIVEPTQLDIPASWGLNRIDQADLPLSNGIPLQTGYTGKGVDIFVIDTGINAEHLDFGTRAIALAEFTDDPPTVGPNSDTGGHGTHCAGTAGGTLLGVASDSNIKGIKVLGAQGGSNSDVIKGVDEAIAKAGTKAAVLSMSLGGTASNAMDTAVNRAHNAGHLVVVAAGNDATDACQVSPARAGGKGTIITVMASTNTDQLSSFSNYGICTDIIAPGSDILSTWIGANNVLNVLSGTSMACPAVSGVAATLLEKNNGNRDAARAELFALAADGKINGLQGLNSPNKLLQTSLPAAQAPPADPPANGSPANPPANPSPTPPVNNPPANPSPSPPANPPANPSPTPPVNAPPSGTPGSNPDGGQGQNVDAEGELPIIPIVAGVGAAGVVGFVAYQQQQKKKGPTGNGPPMSGGNMVGNFSGAPPQGQWGPPQGQVQSSPNNLFGGQQQQQQQQQQPRW